MIDFMARKTQKKIITNFSVNNLSGHPKNKSALLISPPIYDTQYWSRWSQPYGLLKILSLLKKYHYKRLELYDFLEVTKDSKIHKHIINVGESYGEKVESKLPRKKYLIKKNDDDDVSLELTKYHFGSRWNDFENWLEEKGFSGSTPPDEIWISSMMTYWWESTRDLIIRLRNKFGYKTVIIIGGIYPTLSPQHAKEYCDSDLVVVGEVEEANNLSTDFSLYNCPPDYAIITPSRGCPYNCSYCAQKTINQNRNIVEFRPIDDIVKEIISKHDKYGISDFAFNADYLLWDYENYFVPLLKTLLKYKNLKLKLHAPEGLDVSKVSQSQELCDLMKESNFQKIYLPCESIDDKYTNALNRGHVKLDQFVKAVKMCEKAGFQLRYMDINAFVLYGLPEESIDKVVKTILFTSEVVGSIIPMLFSPVPTTRIYSKYKAFFEKKGWTNELHLLNGKLLPFIDLNEGTVNDYVELQRLMYMLNGHYRHKTFQMFSDSLVATKFRDNINSNFKLLIDSTLERI